MAEPDRCPQRDELVQLLLGRLSVERTAGLEGHLNDCDPCLAVVEGLRVESQLVDVLKERPAVEGRALPPELELLMDRLEGLLLTNLDRFAATATEDENVPVLSPAQGPDELGRLAHYRVLEELGSGGMGVVYLAEDMELQRSVALKVLRPRTARNADARAFFLREARAMAAIRHDHVAVVYQVGEARADGGGTATPFLAMELLDGESLQSWMAANRRPPLAWVVRLGRQIASGLAALHARELIHRDVKPANLWLESPPGWRDDASRDRAPLGLVGRAKLLDFGLAFTLGEGPLEATVMGTPAYMAPEHLRNAQLDGRCDLFGLGCVLYELCTGEHPFPECRLFPVFTAPFPASDLNPAVPADLADLIARLLAEDPAARPESARRVVQELATLEKKLAGAAAYDTVVQIDTQRLPSIPPRRARPERRRLLAASGAALAVVVALVWWTANTPRQRGTTPPLERAVLPANQAPFPDGPPDDLWCRKIAELPTDKQFNVVSRKLEEMNPGYSHVTTAGWVEPEAVIRFNDRTDFLSDIRPLCCLPDLKTVVLTGSAPGLGKLTDLRPLRRMRLYWLAVAHNPDLRDLAPLRGMPLFHLDVTDTGVRSLSDVAGGPLEELLIARAPIKDLGPLHSLARLRILDCTGCPIDSLEPLVGTTINALKLDYRPERDAAVLRRATSLKTINGMPAKDFWQRQRAAP